MKSPIAPEEGIDWLFLLCVVLLIATFAGDVVLPGMTIRPLVEAARAISAEEPSSITIPAPPSPLWPVLCLLGDIAVVSISAYRLIQEREFGGRWLWLLAASAAGAFWSLLAVSVLAKANAVVLHAIHELQAP